MRKLFHLSPSPPPQFHFLIIGNILNISPGAMKPPCAPLPLLCFRLSIHFYIWNIKKILSWSHLIRPRQRKTSVWRNPVFLKCLNIWNKRNYKSHSSNHVFRFEMVQFWILILEKKYSKIYMKIFQNVLKRQNNGICKISKCCRLVMTLFQEIWSKPCFNLKKFI